MNTGEEIIEFTKHVIKNVAKIDDIIDKTFEPIKDYTDTLGDLISPVKSIIAISNFKKRLRLKSFITNYATQLENDYEIDEEEILKLQSFFKDIKNVDYISEIIDNAMNSKSIKATAILGILAGKIIKEKGEINYNEFSIIETLKAITDVDINNFIFLFEYVKNLQTNINETNQYRTLDFYKNDKENFSSIKKDSLDLTIERMKRTNGLTYGSGGIGNFGNALGTFEINEISEKLYNLLKLSEIKVDFE